MKKRLILVGVLSTFGFIYIDSVRRKDNKSTSSEQKIYARDGFIFYNE